MSLLGTTLIFRNVLVEIDAGVVLGLLNARY
jgi:hypothetical protein